MSRQNDSASVRRKEVLEAIGFKRDVSKIGVLRFFPACNRKSRHEDAINCRYPAALTRYGLMESEESDGSRFQERLFYLARKVVITLVAYNSCGKNMSGVSERLGDDMFLTSR